MKQRPFEIIFEDDHIIVLNKKAGILSIPDRYHSDADNLYSMLSHYREKIYPLHRLDKDTSGIMIYAKTEDVHKSLSSEFENRKVVKTYLTIVEGLPSPMEGTISTGIAPSQHFKDRMEVVKNGKLSVSHYKVLETFNEYSLLQVTLETGRQHQIRVHMAYIGHPLATDKKYGKRSELYASEIKKKKFIHKKDKRPIPLIKRHSLHAFKIDFSHPVTEEEMSFEAPLPKDMRALINQLRKWN